MKEESVTYVWDEETHVSRVKAAMEKMKAEKEKEKEAGKDK